MWVLFCAFCAVFCSTAAHYYQNYVATETELRAHVGTTVALPCIVDKNQCGQLHSVKWYKDANRVYILSHAGDQRPEGDAIGRMSVQFTPDSVEALLKISPVQAEDEATYKCEITYLEVIDNCDVVQIVKLKTLKKPDKVRITDGSGNQLSNATVLGPKKERAEVELTCEAVGGKPVPQVKWFNRTTELRRAKYSVEGKDDKLTGKSVLKLSLSRGDILARFECRVESDALDEPIISWITTDVQVPPTKVNLIEERNHVVRGEEIKLICNVPGARPAATIRWKNDTHDVTDENIFKTSIEDNLDGTYTTVSYLSFNAAHYQDEDKIQCFAKNDIMVENNAPELYASTILDIKYPPVFNFTAHNITVNESSGNTYVTMNCHFMANPQNLKVIYWLKDGRNLTSTNKKYEGATMKEPSLTIHDIDRDDIGEYTCTVGNEVGLETSEGILLNVQYPPDVEVVMEPSTPVKAVDNSTVLLECNVTSGNPSTLEKVRWFMDGQLMKEFPQCNYSSYDENGVGEGYGGPFCGLDPSILSLEGVVETFAGNYTCQGKNLAGWGTESEPKELIVYYPPSAATLRYSPSDVIKEKSVTLECIVKDPGRPDNLTYKWYRGLHQLADITTSNFTIPTVRLETRSNFTCFAENEGGKGNPATVFINVNAPPLFIQKLPTYQGVLYSSKNINLTCIIECYPECSIIWKKDDVVLDIESNSLYTVETTNIPAHPGTNDFESINSTLIWNIDRWPGKKLDKSAPHSRYTCESSNNSVGPGVSSTIEIAVDYPPENVEVVPKVVSVIEHQAPSTVKCHGEGHPALRYKWSKNSTSEIISTKEELVLGPMKRTDTGKYRCEAENKHGTEFAWAHFIVQYAPECSISIADKDSRPALLCTVHANPANVTFTWRVRESNETILVTSNIVYEDLKSYLYLDSSVDTARTYYCSANNSVGSSMPCERDVAGNLPWWKQLNQDKMIIIIASIIAIIIIVIIICVIIIILCRRKRADTKYNSPLEMEEREKFLCTQSPDVLGLPLVPCGRVTYLGNQVVTFKKVNPSTPVMKPEVVSSRKRKKPGEAPNPSSIEDKARLGAAPPVGGIADPLTDPDKGFYENLPFHGMQNPPNKIKAKIKPSPVQSPADNPSKTILTDLKDDDKTNETFPEIPQMPILNTQIKWSPNISNLNNQPYRPDPCDLEYADVDYKSYGPINYKAASMYAAMKRNKNNNKMEEVNKEDLL